VYKKTDKLPDEMLDYFWKLEANLNNRRHRSLARNILEVYTSIEDGRCESIQLTLENLLEVLHEANQWRQQKLALKKAGIAKAQ